MKKKPSVSAVPQTATPPPRSRSETEAIIKAFRELRKMQYKIACKRATAMLNANPGIATRQ